MLLSAVSVLVVAQSSSEISEGLMNNPVYVFYYYGVTSIGLLNCLIQIQHTKAVCYREILHFHCQVKTVGDACTVGFISES